jgi:uncharacterized protein YqgC (DUF456 family)
MDYVLIILGTICIIVGLLGSVLPVLPGPPLSYVGIILLHLTRRFEFSWSFLIAWAVAVVVVSLLDYYVPIWGTRKFGGGQRGAWGCAFGVVAGVFLFPPWGMIFLPFVGAVIGELTDNNSFEVSLKAGFGAFLGFLAGTIFKVIVSASLAFFFIKDVVVRMVGI